MYTKNDRKKAFEMKFKGGRKTTIPYYDAFHINHKMDQKM